MDPPSAGRDVVARRRAAVEAGHRGDVAAAIVLLDDPDPAVRGAALGALSRAGGLSGEVLHTALGDPEPAVRRRACEEVGRALATATAAGRRALSTTEAVMLLVPALADTGDEVVEAACWATGEAGDAARDSVPLLCAIARQHRAALCREAAVAALGAIGDRRGLESVLGALDDRPAIRRRAALALAAFDDPRAEAGLRRCLGDRDWQVRQAAEELLGS